MAVYGMWLRDPRIGRVFENFNQSRMGRRVQRAMLAFDAWVNSTLYDSNQSFWRAYDSFCAFMDRFTALVGMPPIRYQTLWRMTTAKQYLRETRRSVAQVAYAIGYESEEAFSRAFKREFGMAPSRWRNELSEPLAIPA